MHYDEAHDHVDLQHWDIDMLQLRILQAKESVREELLWVHARELKIHDELTYIIAQSRVAELEHMLAQRSEKDPGANQPEAYIDSGGR